MLIYQLRMNIAVTLLTSGSNESYLYIAAIIWSMIVVLRQAMMRIWAATVIMSRLGGVLWDGLVHLASFCFLFLCQISSTWTNWDVSVFGTASWLFLIILEAIPIDDDVAWEVDSHRHFLCTNTVVFEFCSLPTAYLLHDVLPTNFLQYLQYCAQLAR